MPPLLSDIMARSDSFFIRATLDCGNSNVFQQESIDLGAYVDALGKSVLRIHNIAVQVTNATGTTVRMVNGAGNGVAANGKAQFQLTTQTQGQMITGLDKSVIATGQLTAANMKNTTSFPSIVSRS